MTNTDTDIEIYSNLFGWWRHLLNWWRYVFSKKGIFAQVFVTISKYSVRFDVERLSHNVMMSCMPMTSFGDVINESLLMSQQFRTNSSNIFLHIL